MNELPNIHDIDWEDKDQVSAFHDACLSMTRDELLSYPDKYVIASLERANRVAYDGFTAMFPEAVAWAEDVSKLTLEEFSGRAEALNAELAKMRGLPRLIAWSKATMYLTVEDMPKLRAVHAAFAHTILDLFELRTFAGRVIPR